MMKLMGACLILVTTTWIGFQKAKRYSDRSIQIRQLRSCLSLLKTHIGYGTRPLVEACNTIANSHRGPVFQLFKAYQEQLEHLDGLSSYECFKIAVQKKWDTTALTNAEKEIMLHFARTLGISDREDQLHHVSLADAQLELEQAKARDEQMRNEKMYKTMGVLCGALVIILIY